MDCFKQISARSYIVGWESKSHQRKHPKNFFLFRKIHIIFRDTWIWMIYVVTFLKWVVQYNCWMPTSYVAVVMYYTMAQEKHHPTVLIGWCARCRHYSIFEVMQYEPQSATFQLYEVYLLIWSIVAGWNDKSCIMYLLNDWTYTDRRMSETL